MNFDEFKVKVEEFSELVKGLNYAEMKASELQPYLDCGDMIGKSFKDVAIGWTNLNKKYYQEIIDCFDEDLDEPTPISEEALRMTGVEITENFDPYDDIWEVINVSGASWGYRDDRYENGVELQWEGGWATSYC